MTVSVKQMLDMANAAVRRISPAQAFALISEQDALIVDVRDPQEVEATGKIAGAVNISRGMLEFRADPESQYHDARFDRSRPTILYCASGGRSALGAKVLKDMGFEHVFNLGAFKAWVEDGLPVDAEPRDGLIKPRRSFLRRLRSQQSWIVRCGLRFRPNALRA